jgi:hypothetical protein
MKKKEFKANQEYLEENDVYLSDDVVWDEYPYSRELFMRTDSDGDFSICVEELTREEVLNKLRGFDVNEETILWWGGRGVPFDNIKDLYDDIYQWKEDFIQIAEGMPY